MKTILQTNTEAPMLLEGGIAIDDRGEVGFVNGFDMSRIKRFYTIANHRAGFIRAWHAHKNENKYFTVISGAAVIAGVRIDNWARPSKDAKVNRYVLSSKKPSVLFMPKGYANGFMALTDDTKLMVFSSATLEESRTDDIRYEAHYWDPWTVIER